MGLLRKGIKKIVLSNPKRIVFDFFLPSGTTIVQSLTAKDKVQQATQPKPVNAPVMNAPKAALPKNEKTPSSPKIQKENFHKAEENHCVFPCFVLY